MKLRHIGAGMSALVAAATITLALTAPANAQGEVLVTDKNLQGFDLASETRASGHIEWRDGGLRIYTESNTSTDKVAGFKSTNTALVDVAKRAQDPQLRFRTLEGAAEPGYQLRVNVADGSKPGTLVSEAAYPGRWWSTVNYDVGAGDGYASSAKLETYVEKNPGMKVTAFGFSLGSGVKADGVLQSLTFNGTTFRFAATVVPPTTPPTTTPAPTTTPEPTTEPDPTTTPAPASEPTDDNNGSDNGGVAGPQFATCAEASAAGVYNIPNTSIDYRADMDSDSDGTACEKPDGALDGGEQVSVVPNAVDTGVA